MRDNTADLRIQLEESQKTLALRKEYDDLAEKITSNRLLRPREDQHANLDKLHAEISDLERESQEYAQTWAERRQQFGKIIEEGMHLRRLIRDEKEEVERREGMEEREDGEDGGDGEAGSQRGRTSGFGTPAAADGGDTPMHQSTSQEQERETTGFLLADSQTASSSLSQGKSPLRQAHVADDDPIEPREAEDADMAEDGEVDGESDLVAASATAVVAEDEKGEGEGEGEESTSADFVMDDS